MISCLVIPPNRVLMYVTWPVDNKTVLHYTQQIPSQLDSTGTASQEHSTSVSFCYVLARKSYLALDCARETVYRVKGLKGEVLIPHSLFFLKKISFPIKIFFVFPNPAPYPRSRKYPSSSWVWSVSLATTVKVCWYNLIYKQDLHLLLRYTAYSSEAVSMNSQIEVKQKLIIHEIVSQILLARWVSWHQVHSARSVALSQVHRAMHKICSQVHSAINGISSKIHSAVNWTPPQNLQVIVATKSTVVFDALFTPFHVQAVRATVFLRNLFHVCSVRLRGLGSQVWLL